MKEAFHQTIFLADGKRKDGGGGHSSWSGGTRGLGCSSSGLARRRETERSFPGSLRFGFD